MAVIRVVIADPHDNIRASLASMIEGISGTGTMAMEDTSMAGEGDFTVSSTNTNIRAEASTSSAVVGKLTDGKPTPVTSRTVDGNGFTWLKIEQGWVRADVVQVVGNCAAL